MIKEPLDNIWIGKDILIKLWEYHILGGKIDGLERLTCQAKIGSEESFLDEWF